MVKETDLHILLEYCRVEYYRVEYHSAEYSRTDYCRVEYCKVENCGIDYHSVENFRLEYWKASPWPLHSPQDLHNLVLAQLFCENLDAAVSEVVHTKPVKEKLHLIHI